MTRNCGSSFSEPAPLSLKAHEKQRRIGLAHMKRLPALAKECCKYGLALIVALQKAMDFEAGLFAAIAKYLVLRVTNADARAMARNAGCAVAPASHFPPDGGSAQQSARRGCASTAVP